MNTANDQAPWYLDSSEIARLLRWMDEHDEYGPLEVVNCIEIVASPWKWELEHTEMVADLDGLRPILEASVTLANAGIRKFR